MYQFGAENIGQLWLKSSFLLGIMDNMRKTWA